MGLSHRVLLIDQNERLLRMASAKFQRLLRDPQSSLFPVFSGQRIRSVSMLVDCVASKPVEIVRATYDILTFDKNGQLQVDIYGQQQMSRAEVKMAGIVREERRSDFVDATAKFLDNGGRWKPSPNMTRAIHDAVFGQEKIPRI